MLGWSAKTRQQLAGQLAVLGLQLGIGQRIVEFATKRPTPSLAMPYCITKLTR